DPGGHSRPRTPPPPRGREGGCRGWPGAPTATGSRPRPKPPWPATAPRRRDRGVLGMAATNLALVMLPLFLAGGVGDPLPAGALARVGSPRFRHGGFVLSMAYLGQGKVLATGGVVGSQATHHYGGMVRLWEA